MRSWLLGLAAAGLVAASAVVVAQAPGAAGAAPSGEPQPGASLEDEQFGVVRAGFGLQRRVEMYQWSAGDGGFKPIWNAAPIDSAGFPEAYQNPTQIPLDSQSWWSSTATLDGRPIDPTVLKALGDWQQFRPGFSRLPGNMSATFQPNGDGLSSSENPLHPQIGDLRVRWRELVLPPLAGQVELRDAAWQLAARAPPIALEPSQVVPPPTVEAAQPQRTPWWPWLLGGLVVLAGAGWLLQRRRQRRRS